MSRHSLALLPLLTALTLLACGDKDDDDTGDGGATDTDADTDTDTDTDTTGVVDGDGDGYDETGDCDDSNADIHPGATEICNDIDDDCDDLVDDADDSVDASSGGTFYADGDGDGYGDGADSIQACSQPAGYVEDGTDCDDADADTSPAADEVCNDVDDDCDDEIDEDAVDATTWYLDDDGDGFGDGATGEAACAPPDDRVDDGTDCDDGDAWTFPGAAELCDGVDNDCDDGTTDAGTATWWGDDGTVTDVTTDLTGTSSAPATPTFATPGTLTVCDGTWYVNGTIGHDVSVVGQGADRTSVVLDGAATSSVFIVEGEALDVSLSGVTLTHGQGGTSATFSSSGGGLLCEDPTASSSLTLDDVAIEDNEAALFGGGIMCEGFDIDMTDVEFAGNRALSLGGGMYAHAGGVSAEDVEVHGNSSGGDVAGWYLQGGTYTAEYVLDDVAFTENLTAGWVGGLGVALGAGLTWTGHSHGSAGATANEDAGYGAAIYVFDMEVDVAGVDFGEAGSVDDNVPQDIYLAYPSIWYNAGDDATFSCSTFRCGESVDYAVNDAEGTWYGYADTIQGITFDAVTEDNLDGWKIWASGDADCSAEFFVLGRDEAPDASGSTGVYDYDVEWSSGSYSLAAEGSEEWVGPDDVDLTLELGRSYALVYECVCADTGGYCYTGRHDSTSTADDIGVGETTGFIYGSWDGTGEELGFFPLDYRGDVHTTKVSITAL